MVKKLVKTRKNLMTKVCAYENLVNAFYKARRGKPDDKDALQWEFNLEKNLLGLQEELLNKGYTTGQYRHFTVFEPKQREISALPFRDRVVHHAVCNVIEPIFEKTFVFDSFACRKGKGTHAGTARLQSFLRKKGSKYALKCDVSKYFPSIDHSILKSLIRKKISDNQLLDLLDEIIDSHAPGIPIGNLTSQLFANIYLNKLDWFVKQELRVKYYVRYVDDFVLLSDSKEQLHYFKCLVNDFLGTGLNLRMHPRKAWVFPTSSGVDFLGYRVFPHHRLARKAAVKRFLRKIKPKLSSFFRGGIQFEKLLESFNSWCAHLSHASAFALKKSLYLARFKNVF